LPPPNGRLHYQAGIMAFSPLPRFEELRSQLDRPRSALFDPVLHAFQNIIRDRMIAKGHEPVSGSLRQLIAAEIAGSDPTIAVPVPDGLRYLRLLPHGAEPDGGKLERARVPTLVVQSANDPLIPACDIADLISQTENPNVAGIILPGGGHVGLVAYAREYYFSLILNFFDSTIGPVATP
jgi:pimeloyl-ACP methyl ester carboxylesterase